MTPVRLTGDQATLLLSSMWSELNMDNNLPANYEAIFATFSLVILFSPPTVSNKDILVYPLNEIIKCKFPKGNFNAVKSVLAALKCYVLFDRTQEFV